MNITLTDKSQQMIRKFLAAEPARKVFRVGVQSGGCSGFSYKMEISERANDDLVQAYEGFDIVIDSISAPLLNGLILDYTDTIGHAGFTFTNPQAKSSCGCGTSFDV